MLKWFDIFQALVLLASVGVAAVAACYSAKAYKTALMAQAPCVVVYADMHNRMGYVAIKNTGYDTAKNVTVNIVPEFPPEYDLGRAGFLHYSIPVVLPGQEYKVFVGSSVECLTNDVLKKEVFTAKVTYSWHGKERCDENTFSFRIRDNTLSDVDVNYLLEKELSKIAKAAETIERRIEGEFIRFLLSRREDSSDA